MLPRRSAKTDHADEPNNDTPNAAAEVEKEKPADFMSELASKLGGPQQKKKDKAVVESVSITIYYLVYSGVWEGRGQNVKKCV